MGIGITIGYRLGIGTGVAGPVTGGTVDAASGKAVLQSAAEYASRSLTAPQHLWLLQDASGNPTDVIGGIALTPNSAPGYQAAVAGWNTKAIHFTDATANQQLASTNALLPDISTTSALLLMYVRTTTVGATRGVAVLGTTTAELRAIVTPAYRMQSNGNPATGALNPTGQVRPVILQVDRTNNVVNCYTDQEKLTPAFDATMTGKQLILGYSGGTPPTMDILYAALWKGAPAEMTNAQVKNLLTSLNWTVTGY